MNSFLRLISLASLAVFLQAAQAANVDYVDPCIGTADLPHDHGVEYGGTMPFVETPFAMTSWTPQTRRDRIGATSYNYADTNIFGFMGTHQPAIWMGDYGYVTLMPEVDAIQTTEAGRKLPFSHGNETSTPYYYSVSMDAGASRKIKGEITATDHCALMRFTYPQNKNSSIVVEATRSNVTGNITIDPTTREITGYNPDRMDAKYTSLQLPNFRGYYVIQISKPFLTFGTYQGPLLNPGATNVTTGNVGGYATFATRSDEQVLVKIGTSFISVAQARSNLDAEIPDWNFNGTKNRLRNIWNQKLAEVSIRGGTRDQLVQFYTGMYHCMLYPRLFSEQGRYYSAFDDQIHDGVAYTDYSGWDIFRSEVSFLTIFCPERIDGMIQALLNDYKEGGWMPKWPNPSYTDIMISTHADSIVAEAVNKGFHGFDYNLAYSAVYKDAMTPPNGDMTHTWGDRVQGLPYSAREGLTYYLKYGYVPENWTLRAASCTLEGAYDDWCVAQVAKAVDNTDDYNLFLARSLNYRHVFNHATGQMNSRNADGTWAPTHTGWSEGGQGMYDFAVMQDIPGLIRLMGGPAKFNARLDKYTKDLDGLVNNEPGNHYVYLYDFSGEPAKCQALTRYASTNFCNGPMGLPGNDDCGQTSSWLLFANLGFYPVNPASGVYMIGSPIFRRITLHLPNGRTFTVTTSNNSASNKYIQSATLNSAALDIPCITYAQIEAGGLLHFVMGPSPSPWASHWQGVPISVMETQNEQAGSNGK